MHPLIARYSSGKIVEINSHSLFSKWFSESGKLVQKLFSAVNRMVDDEDCFVVVMIGERGVRLGCRVSRARSSIHSVMAGLTCRRG